ncbi:uncharacterized protein DUF3304 [Paludibacterium purpuratum]|uniref:Uncharacterized protein DUF3304 n=2 Tax=Paludibacterium purpuratum TaxID=1144873 RepID=A0A4R7B041_9NEIS|nr:uncharacterized protein DUF3304 [Paludibacterium purpuratum]
MALLTRFTAARRLLLACCVPLLAACASLHAEDTIGLGVSNVNYSGTAYDSALAVDPVTDKSGGGEAAMPYGAGGLMCCYSLPAKWRPGIQVEVRLLKEKVGKTYKERAYEQDVWIKQTVEVPPYQGSPGTLWIVIYPDGQVAVHATNYEPSNPNWPGKIKGWPVPSVEYRRMLWDRKMDERLKEKRIFENAIIQHPQDKQKFSDAVQSVNDAIQRLGKRP